MTEITAEPPPPSDRIPDEAAAGSPARAIADYAAAVASRAPAPGGGSVVGVTAALAAALGAMVCRFTLPETPDLTEPNDVGDPSELISVLAELDRLRLTMLDLAEADAAAYASYRTAAALPKATEADRDHRRRAMHTALVASTDVPLAVARGSARLHTLLTTVARLGNPHLRSDAHIATLLAAAALHGALLNVRGNAALLKDAQAAARYVAEAAVLERVFEDGSPTLARNRNQA